MTDTLAALTAIVAAQQASIERLVETVERQTQSVEMLTAAVAELLGEEMGSPVDETPAPAPAGGYGTFDDD